MATKYHIKDDGTPGKCDAASQESCPKTKAGDSFHGTLEEATQESEKRFDSSYGSIAPAKRAEFTENPSYSKTLNLLMGKPGAAAGKNVTLADRARSGEYDDSQRPLGDHPYKGLAFSLNRELSDDDRNYIYNNVPLSEIEIFTGENKSIGAGAMKELVKAHREVTETHGSVKGLPFVQSRIPEDKRKEMISSGSGIGSLRPWGQPSNSIQNTRRETAEMLAHRVVDRYGAENAEKFWSSVNGKSSGRNRATLSHVFQTFREFDREAKASKKAA